MAMTAWSAKVLRRSIWRSGNGPTCERRDGDRPDGEAVAQHRNRHDAPVRHGGRGGAVRVVGIRMDVRMHGRPGRLRIDRAAALPSSRRHRIDPAHGLDPVDRQAVMRDEVKELPVEPEDPARTRPHRGAPRCRRCVEDGLDVGRGAGDDAQDLAGRRLLLERLGEIAVSLLQLLEEPDVLDGDDRLVGERLEELDLPVREGSGLARDDGDRPDRDAVAQHRDGHGAAVGGDAARRRPARSSGSASTSGMWATPRLRTDRPAALPATRRPRPGATHGLDPSGVNPCGEPRSGGAVPSKRNTKQNCASQRRAALLAMVSKTGWTSVGELEMTRRISPVAVCCSRVSVRSRFRRSSSWKRRTFSTAITAWSAKVPRRAICPAENGRTSVRRIMMAPIGLALAEQRDRERCVRCWRPLHHAAGSRETRYPRPRQGRRRRIERRSLTARPTTERRPALSSRRRTWRRPPW